jgi:5'-methylthioadenosine phosphorylase
MQPVEVGILGGSGLYDMEGLVVTDEVDLETPFGKPSDRIRIGELEGRRVAFLARHGRGHRLLPGEINYRANVCALKMLGAGRLLSASAVGSLREDIHPLDIVLPDQFYDRTQGRASTFFGDGAVAHVTFGDPVCADLADVLERAAGQAGRAIRRGGTYVCMEGPQFSTRAESSSYRAMGFDVIGMTNLQEAKLAREAEICFATLALVTDYDCWHEEETVNVEVIVRRLSENAAAATGIIRQALRLLGDKRGCPCATSLENAVLTRQELIPAATRERLKAVAPRIFA